MFDSCFQLPKIVADHFLAVDIIQEVIIENLDDVYENDPTIAGGTILGDGQVVLILDPAALVQLSGKAKLEQSATDVSSLSF